MENKELKQIQDDNKDKNLLKEGDIVISEKYGVGFIFDIEPTDCWYPLGVIFEEKIFSFGKIMKNKKQAFYNCKGQTNSMDDDKIIDAKFYRQIL